LEVDLKAPEGNAIVRKLTRSADGLIEGFRPGVMERLGLAPEILLKENPRLVFGRMTGWGQSGPNMLTAGHDINYIALAGNLHTYGRANEGPIPPINAVGDFGGGAMFLAFGMLAGIISARQTGRGQVIDSSMTEGAAVLSSIIWAFRAGGDWNDERGTNFIDTGSHYYNVYETRDGRHIAIGPVEEKFWRILCEKIGLDGDTTLGGQNDREKWPANRLKLAARFREKTRDEWVEIFEGTDACFSPVLSMEEAPNHPHSAARNTFVSAGGVVQPAPCPRFLDTPSREPAMPSGSTDTDAILSTLGYSPDDIRNLKIEGVVN
jgi:alpha-methylacyl-CoA racemase